MTDSYFSFLVSSGHTADDQPLQLLPANFALGNMSIMMTTNFKKSTSMTRLRPEGAEQVKIYFLFSTIFASTYVQSVPPNLIDWSKDPFSGA